MRTSERKSGAGSTPQAQAYFDIIVDRKPLGRVVIEVPAGAPAIGGQRFLDLAQVRWTQWCGRL